MNKKIEVKGVYKIFGGKPKKALELVERGVSKETILKQTKQVIGLNDVSLTIEEGEVFVVMGLSGSGKSTLVRCLNRLMEPTKGEILIDGEDITKLDKKGLREVRRQKISMVFQNFGLFPHMNILDNVAYGLKVQKVDKEQRYQKAREAIETVGLGGWEASYPKQLSGGMQQRVGLARALANDPDILLMDEAFSALDPLIRTSMQDELLALQSKLNKTIVFITHDLDEALKLGDHIALMKDGEVVQVGTPEEILTSPADAYVERFVENVDMTKALSVSSVMRKPPVVARLEDSPKILLKKMLKHQVYSLYMVDDEGHVLGVITKERLVEAMHQGGAIDIEVLLIKEVKTCEVTTDMEIVFEQLASSRYPVAVLSANKELTGIVAKKDIIKTIVEKGA